MKTKIKDIEEFCKLYKINIPVEEEFDYYIEILKQSEEFRTSLENIINSYIELEDFVSNKGYSNVRAYKNECMDKLIEYIITSKAYKNMQASSMPSAKMHSKDYMNIIEDGQLLISMDFKSANYNVLKTFMEPIKSSADIEFPGTWIELCERFDIHPALYNSKSFRQIVFGNTNPKRLQTFQHDNILNVLECLMTNHNYQEEDFVFISHDELIVKAKRASNAYKISDISGELSAKAMGMPIGVRLFSMRKLKKNTFIKTVYSFRMSNITNSNAGINDLNKIIAEPMYDTLHGVQGHKFYMYFKKYILKKPLDERDLMFYIDNELAKWVI